MSAGSPAARLRIGHVSLHTNPFAEPGSGDVGGMNVVVAAISRAMGAAGHEVHVFTRAASDSAIETSPAPGVRLHHIPAGPAHPIPKGEHEDLIDTFAASMAQRMASQAIDLDVWHSHHWFSGIAVQRLATEHNLTAPLVHSYHSIAADPSAVLARGERPESPGRLAGERHLAATADLIIANSNAEARTAIDDLGATETRVRVIPPGVDVEVFRPLESCGERGAPYAVIAARLEELKGIDLALNALALIEPGARPQLFIVGGATDDRDGYPQFLARLAQQLSIAESVTFTGPMTPDALATLLRGARMLLVPSHSETYGLIALEAAASGTPVIASATGGLVESVADGVSGILLGDRCPQHWAESIEHLASDASAAAALGTTAREHAKERTWERSAGLMVAAYRELSRI